MADENTVIESPPQEDASLGAEDGAVSTVGGDTPTRDDGEIQAGVCAPGDDWQAPSQTAVGTATGSQVAGRPTIPSEFTQKITPRPNRLAKMASQTYSLSMYILSPEDFTRLSQAGKKALPAGSQLLIQSGGIQGSSSAGTRNKYFDVDFYFDEVTLGTAPPVYGQGGAGQAMEIKMSIIEPNGISLLQRLNLAIREVSGVQSETIGLASGQYLLVIRFYGYDENGNLISGTQAGYSEPGSDSNALVEKFYPFKILDINYQISSKLVEYELKCAMMNLDDSFGQNKGTIPYNWELSAADVKTLLGGQVGASGVSAAADSSVTGSIGNARNAIKGASAAFASGNPAQIAAYTQATLSTVTNAVGSVGGFLNGFTAPAKASAISKTDPSSINGLTQALNQWQKDLVQEKSQDYPDIYTIEILNIPGLIDATLTTQGDQDKTRAVPNKSDNPSTKQLDSKNSYDKDTKTWSVTAGTQIVQLIDLVLRNSTYITSQQNITFPADGGPPKPQKPSDVVMWYTITPTVEPYQFDKKRNMYASKIKYIISPYLVVDPRNPYFTNKSGYRGSHKLYNWWFTGQNTEVLDWVIDVKSNFATPFGNGTPNSAEQIVAEPTLGISQQKVFQTRPNQSSQGGKYQSTMPAANLAERLYNGVKDLAGTEITILGDPDWLVQSTVFYTAPSLSAWAADGSINQSSGPMIFEINFNAPTDYDLQSGIMPVNTANDNSYSSMSSGTANQRAAFVSQWVSSTFKDGKFTQKIKGAWINMKNTKSNAGASADDMTGVTVQTAEDAAQDTQTMEEMADTIREGTPTDTTVEPEYDPKQIDSAYAEATTLATVPDRYAGPVDLSGFDDGAGANQNQSREA